ncbi:N-acetylglucosaminylphosphatidylinositol deacetylase [Nematocida sp. LUAm3]|nr:N-acetylglucosaminylphosphatidylinositol deacetylase [Nematocida sp. LUAm3]KAI5175701.1 N-acetylglucosaminylphosphatidylinositol deacetylase [Nematocida sp. LUAm2]KAI5178607.1 N-acetylglucosaminylphosphatidylinositol deacetylase [Nematocida sp. LUAm1]
MIYFIILWFLIKIFLLKRIVPSSFPERRTLLITAHPDDESMFFGPFLSEYKRIIIAVCTDGSRGGIKEIRREEMLRVSEAIKASVYFLEEKDGELSASQRVLHQLIEIVKREKIERIVTFDGNGVSKHLDHVSCYNISLELAKILPIKEILVLKTLSLIEKYVFAPFRVKGHLYVRGSLFSSIRNRRRMLMHTSQMKWFRCLWVIFSSYMDVNVYQHMLHTTLHTTSHTTPHVTPHTTPHA